MTCRNGLKYWRPAGSGPPLRGGAEQGEAGRGELALEVAAVVALVADDDLPRGSGQAVADQDAEQDEPLVAFGPGQGEPDGQAVQGAEQVQPQSPEPARVRGAVPVLGPPGQLRPLDGLPGTAAFHRGGIDDPHVVRPQSGIGGQHPDHRGDQPGCARLPG